MRFEGFYGNDRTKEILSGMFDSRRIPHAILIDGPQGAGKKTLARIIAAAAVCTCEGEVPCGECRQCKNALSGVHPDINLYEGTSPRSFGVDLVRQIRDDAYVAPNDAEKKVFILANVQNMTAQAQNALLKVLEEPPASVLFILTCDLSSHVLETVRSRAQSVSVGAVAEADAVRALLEQCEGISGEDAARAARISGGIIGRAKLMLGEGFSQISAFTSDFVKTLCSSDLYAFLRLSGRLEKDGDLFASFLDLLPALFRDAITVHGTGKADLSGFDGEARVLSRTVTAKRLYEAELAALDAQKAAVQNANLTLLVTTLFSRLWHIVHE